MNEKKWMDLKKIFFISLIFLVFALVFYLSFPNSKKNLDMTFSDIKQLFLNSFSQARINPIITEYNGNYKVKIRTGNESLYDVTFNKNNKTNLTTICLEAGWDSKQILTFDDDEKPDKNYTYSVPSTLSFYKTNLLSKQADLIKTKDSEISATSPSNPNKFCYQANPKEDFYLKFGDNSIIIIQELDVVGQSLLINVTAETGAQNFTHLNVSNEAPYDDLVFYMPFDGDKTNAKLTTHYDFTGYNNDGTGVADALVNSTNCVYDDCLQLDGSGDYVDCGQDSSLDLVNATLSAWVKRSNIGTFHSVAGKYSSATLGGGYLLAILDTNIPAFYVRERTGGSKGDTNKYDYAEGTTTIAAGTWYHLVGTWDGTIIRMYVNGVNEDNESWTGSINNDVYDCEIGGFDNGDNPLTLLINGTIDDVMIFNTTLTQAQISDIFNNQSARFMVQGLQQLNNQTTLNISSGNNRVNVTTIFENASDSKINLSIGYYDTDWSFTDPQTIINGINFTFEISNTATNLTLNYTLIAGNTSVPFFTPIMKGDIILDVYSSVVGDTTNPDVVLNAPVNNFNTSSISLTFNGTAGDNINLTNVTLYGNWTGSFHANETNSSGLNDTEYLFTKSIGDGDGLYIWNYQACDNSSNCVSASNRTFRIDTTPPFFNDINNITFTEGTEVNSNINGTDLGVGIFNFSVNDTTFDINKTGWLRNITALEVRLYFINVSVNDTLGNENGSIIFVNITSIDNIFPTFTSPTEFPAEPTTYSFGQIYEFNITVKDTNGTVGLQFDGINFTSTNLSADDYNATFGDLAVGNFSYYWWGFGNGTIGNFNRSETFNYNISRAIPEGNLTNSTSLTVTFPTSVTIGLEESQDGDSDVTYEIFRDDVSIGTGETATLGVASYNYSLNTTGGNNWTANASMDNFTLTVNQGTSVVNLSLDNVQGNVTILQGSTINLNCSIITGDAGATLVMHQEEGTINTGTSPIGNITTFNTIGAKNITCFYENSQNFTASKETWWVNVNARNVSLNHFEFEIEEITFNSETYILILNSTFNLTFGEHVTFKGVGAVRKNQGATTNTVWMKLTVNEIVLFDSIVRSVSNTQDRGVFNLPINDTETSAGTNNITLEVREVGVGSVNISSVELFGDTDTSNDGSELNHSHEVIGVNFSSSSFINLANFTHLRTPNSTTMVDVIHTFQKDGGGSSVPECYLENNVSLEITPTYSRFLSGSGDSGSSGINYKSEIYVDGSETWRLWCKSSNADNIINNVTFYAFDLVNAQENIIGNFQNQTNSLSISGLNNRILSYSDYLVKNNSEIQLLATVIIQSTSGAQIGDSSPSVKINSSTLSESNCSHTYARSLDSNSDIGTIKMYVDCENISAGESHDFNIYVNVEGAESLDVLNASFSGIEIEELDTTIGIVPPLIAIINPLDLANVSGIIDINATVSDLSELGWASNITLLNTTFVYNITIYDDGGVFNNVTNASLDTTTVSDGDYIIQWNVSNDAGANFDRINITIDNTPPDLNITFPINNTNTTDTGLDINYTFIDAGVNNEVCWYSNDTMSTNTTLANCVNITTVTWTEGQHNVTVWVNDTLGNENRSSVSFTIDTTAPVFDDIENITISDGVSLNSNINASDSGVGLDSFSINWTSTFSINSTTGNLTNSSALSVRIYFINVTVNDTLGNQASNVIFVNVTAIDTTPPTFDNLINHTQQANISFSYDLDATDTSGIDTFTLNNTNFFNISSTGLIINVTNLSRVEIHYLNVTVNDTLGNLASGQFFINITTQIITLILTVHAPINRTYDSSEIALNVSAVNGTTITYLYSLDSGSNTSFIPNITLNNLGWEAYHELQVWVNDSSGNSDTIIRRFYLGEVSWTTAFIIGIVGLISIYALAGFYIFDKEYWLIKSFMYFSAFGMLIVLINSARIFAVGSESTTIVTTGYIIGIVSLSVMFLYLFVFFFIEIVKSLKEKKGVRWKY